MNLVRAHAREFPAEMEWVGTSEPSQNPRDRFEPVPEPPPADDGGELAYPSSESLESFRLLLNRLS